MNSVVADIGRITLAAVVGILCLKLLFVGFLKVPGVSPLVAAI